MRWFRSKIWFGTRLALFALALQVVFTSGHVDGISDGLASDILSAVVKQFNAAAPDAQQRPEKSNLAGDDICPICVLIQLVNTSAPAVAPVLPVPGAFVVFRRETLEELQWVPSPHLSFQARGPPSI